MKIKNNISISFIFGILIILFILWNRLIRVRLPKEIIAVSKINLIHYIIGGLTILFLILVIYNILLYFKYLPRESSKINKLINYILEYLSKYSWFNHLYKIITVDIPNGPLSVYELFYKYTYVKPYIEKIGIFLHDQLFNNTFRINACYIIFFILPRFLVSTMFLIDICYFKQLNYFYKVLILLLIPLLSKLILFVIKHHAITCLDFYNNFFEFKYYKETKLLQIYCKPLAKVEDITLQNEYIKYIDNLHKSWIFYQYLYNVSYQILNYKVNRYKYYINIIYYTMFFLGFLFYLLILVGFYTSNSIELSFNIIIITHNYLKTSTCNVIVYNKVIKRSVILLITKRIYAAYSNHVRPYATRTFNYPTPHQGPLAAQNNPGSVHKELVKTTCIIPGCNTLYCLGLCANASKSQSVAHATTGEAPSNEPGKTTVKNVTKDGKTFNGNQEDQNLVFYDTPHDSSTFGIDETWTNKLNNDSKAVNIVLQNEDWKYCK